MKIKIQSKPKTVKKKLLLIMSAATLSVSMMTFAKDSSYAKGQKQLDNKEWQNAQNTFASLVAEKNGRQDAALYWLAYSQFKNSRGRQALKSIAQLRRDFPESSWLDDARALKVEIQDKNGEANEINDDEMKLYAIDSLMNSSSGRAIGILGKILKSDNSNRIKKRALFVLSQINNSEGNEVIARLAVDDSNKTLQIYAIEVLGISGSKSAIDLLEKIYTQSNNTDVKIKVLNSYMIANHSDKLLSLAKLETKPELKSKAIHLLGVLSKQDALLKMYQEASFKNHRREIIKSIGIGGGANALHSIIESEKNEDFLVLAVKQLGIMSSGKTGEYLTELYSEQENPKVLRAIIHSLFIQSNAKALINIVKQEKNPDLKRKALKNLSLITSDEAIDYFDKILEN